MTMLNSRLAACSGCNMLNITSACWQLECIKCCMEALLLLQCDKFLHKHKNCVDQWISTNKIHTDPAPRLSRKHTGCCLCRDQAARMLQTGSDEPFLRRTISQPQVEVSPYTFILEYQDSHSVYHAGHVLSNVHLMEQ